MAYRRSVTYCRCVSLPSHQRDLSAIDAELALLSKVRTVVARAGKPTPALWVDQLLDERNARTEFQDH